MRKLTLLFVAGLAAMAQTAPAPPAKQERDLQFEAAKKAPGKAAVAPVIPRSYALVVGIAQYQNLPAAAQLKFPERDAEAIYSILISPEGGNFKAENVHMLSGPKATLANLRHELEEWLPTVTKDDDRVLIYFAGHGFVKGGRAYLAPYDIRADDIPSTGYPMDQLGQVFGTEIKGKWKVLLTDSCHSGAITPVDDNAVLSRRLLDLNKSVFSLTASRDRERSYESDQWGGGHGIFTYYVVRGLEGYADESGDGVVTADELAEYVRRNVREATSGGQNPTSDRGSFDSDMLLAYLPSGVSPGAPPPAKFGTLVIESNMDGVEVFVNGKSVGVVDKSKPLSLPGLTPGAITIKAVKMGYEPDGPREEMVYPGQETTVSVKIIIPRRRQKAAVDKFDRGMEFYNKGTPDAYKKAIEEFQAAFQTDPAYSQAALYMARVYQALFDLDNARLWAKKAIEIDPDYMDARAAYGGILLDVGDFDEAIRQLNLVTHRDRTNQIALYLQARTYFMKEMFEQSVDSARAAIVIAPNNGEAHLWLAESLRHLKRYDDSSREYKKYLEFSNFDPTAAGKTGYYFTLVAFGVGTKKRAAQRDIWKEQRYIANFGLCENAKNQGRYDEAIGYCREALRYDPEDAFTFYELGLAYEFQARETGTIELLAAARTSFSKMLNLNSDLAESEIARKNIATIDAYLRDNR